MYKNETAYNECSQFSVYVYYFECKLILGTSSRIILHNLVLYLILI